MGIITATHIGLAQASPRRALPQTARRGETVDVLHGTTIPDPYRWMEETGSQETVAWIRSQDRYAREVVAAWAPRDSVRARIARSTVPAVVRAPVKEGGRYFYTTTRGAGPTLSYSLFVRGPGDKTPRVILSADSLMSAEGLHVRQGVPSPDGKLIAYAVAHSGDIHETIRVREVDTGRDLDDRIDGIDGAQGRGSLVWARRGDGGFFYTQFTRTARVADSTGRRQHPRIFFHKLGSAASSDRLVYERPDHPEWLLTTKVSDDGRYLIISAQVGVERKHRIFYRDLTREGSEVVPLIPEGDAEFVFVGNSGNVLWFQTNSGAANSRVIAIDAKSPARASWKELIPESKDAIDTFIGTVAIGDRLFVTYRVDAVLVARMFDDRGRFLSTIKFAEPFNSMWAASGRQTDPEGFYVLQGVADPATVYSVDARTGSSSEFSRSSLPYDPHDFVTEQVFFKSLDGTRVPMYVVRHKGTKLDGNAPGILYGYGFNAWAGSPWFQPMITEWMREGGVWALANIRGGGEYGAAWEAAGRRRTKQTAIDDYIAASEWLVAHKYVAPRKLVANSNSAGGVVAAAAMQQRPLLYGAAVLDYPVIDMLRYHKFSGGARWTQEYGTVDDSADFTALRAYAPLQRVQPGVCYPPTLLAPGEKDLVASPMHAYKFAAALQYSGANTPGCTSPALLRVSWGAGHSAGPTPDDQFDTWADELAFLHIVLRW